MQIRTLFFAGMFALAAMAASLGGWVLARAVEDYQLAGRMQHAVEISSSLFAVADALVAERPVAGDALLPEGPTELRDVPAILRTREASDRAIAAAELEIGRAPYSGAQQQLGLLLTFKAELAEWRRQTEETLAVPKSRRNPDFFAGFLAEISTLSETLAPAMSISDFAALQHDGVALDLMALNRQMWLVRESTRPLITMLLTASDGRRPLSAAEIDRQPWLDGRVTERWAEADVLWTRLAGVPEVASRLAEPLASARAAFDAQNDVHKALLQGAANGGLVTMAPTEIGRLARKTTRAFTISRDAALAAARTRVQRNQQAAGLRVAMAEGAVLLIAVLTTAVLGVLCRRIISPVLALTQAIDRLALRDYAVEIPAKTHRDEIGRMAAAVETLRQGAIAAVEAEARLEHMARHDTLTGLPNRTLLHERMHQAVSLAIRGRKCAALSVDLDRFKTINDSYGHQVGDRVLQSVAERLAGCGREADTVSRIGADEFVVLSVDLEHAEGAAVLAQRIVSRLSEPHDVDGHVIAVGVSIGIATAPQDATTAAALMRGAATALDRAKQDAPGTYRFFEPEMDARLQARLTLERDLREAVRSDAFEVMYQPQYNLAEDRLCGFEALLRWHHPVRGMVSPCEFIPLAEETGLIVPIGAWVLRQACAEAMNWPAPVKVAVNLSAVQFKNHPLTDTVRQALEASGLPARRLDLEITESLLLNDNAGVIATLHALHALGASISMDDFGTGYSSLSYLRSFPFDKIKIDQSFVRDLSKRTDSQAIIRAVVAMGRSLGMTTTAEGVETADQLDRLRREGCTEAQGYLFSKPISAEAARALANSLRQTSAVVV
jgi:diguanylate cyclase (GGDEF)-like protein